MTVRLAAHPVVAAVWRLVPAAVCSVCRRRACHRTAVAPALAPAAARLAAAVAAAAAAPGVSALLAVPPAAAAARVVTALPAVPPAAAAARCPATPRQAVAAAAIHYLLIAVDVLM